MIENLIEFSKKLYLPSPHTLAQMCDITGISLLEMMCYLTKTKPEHNLKKWESELNG